MENALEKLEQKELANLLYEALEIIWYMEAGFSYQKEATEFMKKCNYNFYTRPKQ